MANVAVLSAQTYTLDQRKIANWSTTQEKQISTDYPFTLTAEPIEQTVARTYLQFLWLPESIMPLHLLVPSLRRINPPSSSTAQPHPVHALLEPLLLTPRRTSNKYHMELPQILADGGGAGEMEETMMWYAVTHEKAGDGLVLVEDADGPWVDVKWKEAYLERMEKREVQIQILLLMYKLSLPGPAPPPPLPPGKKKRRRIEIEPDPTTEDYLESFMDKLSTWQLIGTLDRPKPHPSAEKQTGYAKSNKDDRDWIQIFAEDVIEHEFKNHLPDLCATLRSKVFPSSPFSDPEDDAEAHSAAPISQNVSPESPPIPKPRAPSRALSTHAIPHAPSTSSSPTLSTSSRATTTKANRALARSRSRSLSVSLAQEQEERERFLHEAQPNKRILNREVSMSRAFKPKAAPLKPQTKKSEKPPLQMEPRAKKLDLGVTLVDETPEKPQVLSASLSAAGGSFMFGQPKFRLPSMYGNGTMVEKPEPPPLAPMNEHDEDEEEWMMDSSPDIVLLNPPLKGRGGRMNDEADEGEDEDEDELMMVATPTKPSRSGMPRKRKR